MTEWRLLSPRLAFMQIREAVVGKQLRIHGNIVCPSRRFYNRQYIATYRVMPEVMQQCKMVNKFAS